MVKNIIFDMGQVLIRFDQDLFISRFHLPPEDALLLKRRVYLSSTWPMMDRGLLTDEEAADRISATVPEHLRDIARRLVLNWFEPVLPVPGMADVVKSLHAQGYGIYLLSNASFLQHKYWPDIPGHEYFTDTLVSADVRMVKPNTEIYACACSKFGIDPAESLFIDDNNCNIEACLYWGMDGIVFHGDIPELKEQLASRGVII